MAGAVTWGEILNYCHFVPQMELLTYFGRQGLVQPMDQIAFWNTLFNTKFEHFLMKKDNNLFVLKLGGGGSC